MKKIKLYFLLIFIILGKNTNAQNFYGHSSSNQIGPNAVFINPTESNTQKTKFALDIAGVNLYTNWSENLFNFTDLLNFNDSTLSSLSKLAIFDKLSFHNLFEVRPFGIQAKIANKLGIGLTSRIRLFGTAHQFDKTLFDIILNRDSSVAIQTQSLDVQNSRMNLSSLIDYGINLSFPILENENNSLIIGGTFRIYKSLFQSGFNFNNIQMTIDTNTKMVTTNSLDLNAYSTLGNISSNPFGNISTISDVLGFLKNNEGAGKGGDIGISYIKKDKSYNRGYKLKIGASILDIGNVSFDSTLILNIKSTGAINFDADSLNFHDGSLDSISYSLSRLGINTNLGTPQKQIFSLPKMLSFQGDYSINKNIYVNFNAALNLNSVPQFGTYYPSTLTLTPRFESKVFDFYIPVGYNLTYKQPTIGAGIRFLFFYLGSNDLTPLLKSNSNHGNIYFGLNLGFGKSVKKNIYVEPLDLAKEEQVKLNDTVKIEVPPTVKIVEEKDTDKDGIIDEKDECPNEIGPPSNKGCPYKDTDKDGIIDDNDECPNTSGIEAFKGCPDTDNDGLKDEDDQCPSKAGPIALQGCPDTDNDGISDLNDRCPNVPGLEINKGCPEIKETVKKRIALAASAIQFETGKDIIKPISYSQLDDLVKILNEYADYSLNIDGHTDNVGNDAINLELSERRAISVKNYFMSKGINEARLIPTGYGETKPLFPNTSAINKAKNRRVEMKLFLQN